MKSGTMWQAENSIASQTQVPKDFQIRAANTQPANLTAAAAGSLLWSVSGQTAYTANETRTFDRP